MILFRVVDVFGKEIELTLERFEHFTVIRPELMGREEIKDAIQFPDISKRSLKDKKTQLFHKRIKNNKYLVVVIKHRNSKGFINTAYISRGIKQGETTWKK